MKFERPNGLRKVKIKPVCKIEAYEILARHKGSLKEPERPPVIPEINFDSDDQRRVGMR